MLLEINWAVPDEKLIVICHVCKW